MSTRTRFQAVGLMMGTVLSPVIVSAQERDMGGAAPLAVVVHVTRATMSGDTATLSYVVENTGVSGEDLWTLLVAPLAPVTAIVAPHVGVSAGPGWITKTVYQRQPAAIWSLIANSPDLTHPGHSTPPLTFSALGLPDTVHYWATPNLDAHPPLDLGDAPPSVHLDMFKSYADSGVTVGVSPVSNRSPAGLLARAGRLLNFACGSAGWIASAGVCQSLLQKLDAAARSVASADSASARGQVQAFANELEAQHGPVPGKFVSEEAYSLLRANIDSLIALL